LADYSSSLSSPSASRCEALRAGPPASPEGEADGGQEESYENKK